MLASTQNQFFFELAEAIRYELGELGVRSSISTEGFPEPRLGTATILLPPHEYYALEGHATPPDSVTFGRTILICCEQPESSHFSQNLQFARGAAAVFDINRRSVRAFRGEGVSAEHLRIGYTKHWDHYDVANNRDRPIDVAFMGAYTRRRGRILGGLADALWRYNCELHLSDNSTPNTARSASFLADEDKWTLLTRAKTLLNVHQGDEPYFEWLRVVEAMHAGCVVVSEASTDYAPLEPGEHLIVGRPESLGFITQSVLDDPSSMDATRTSAYEFLRDQLPMRAGIARLAEAVERAARLSVDGRGTNPRRPVNPQYLPNLDDPPPPSATGSQDASELRRALKDTQLQLMDLKRDIARINQMLRDGRPPTVRIDAATSAYVGSDRPRVSILTPLYNHAEHIAGALDSALNGWFRDLEFVIVDDGSTDRSRDAVREWMARHDDVPAVIISHPVNRGLPSARNTCLDFARGEFSLILDADNELLPRCLERLLNALDHRPQASFAYGILIAFDTRGPSYLLSAFDWEPRRLRRENYIDALALIRTRALHEIGGFKTDRRLYGVEDWDLWATMADAGHEGVFVREMVARYRVSPTSMLSLTNLSPKTMYAAMIEHHPDLMRGVKPPL